MKAYSAFFMLIVVASLTVLQGAMAQDFDIKEIRDGVETLMIHEDGRTQAAVLLVLDSAAAEFAAGKDPQTFPVFAAFLMSDGKGTGAMAQQLLEASKQNERQSWQEDLATVTRFKLATRSKNFASVAQLYDAARASATRLGESDFVVLGAIRDALGYDKQSFAMGVNFLFCTSLADEGKYDAALKAANILDAHLHQQVKTYVTALRNPINLKEIEDAALKRNIDEQKSRKASE